MALGLLVGIGRAFRKKSTASLDILTAKKGPRNYYKGKNCKPTGFHTRKGGWLCSCARKTTKLCSSRIDRFSAEAIYMYLSVQEIVKLQRLQFEKQPLLLFLFVLRIFNMHLVFVRQFPVLYVRSFLDSNIYVTEERPCVCINCCIKVLSENYYREYVGRIGGRRALEE